jgi:carboxylesterase type B
MIAVTDTNNIFTLSVQDPVPPKPWTGIWNASLPGSMCLQYNKAISFIDDHDPLVGDEDCLFINVYTPKVIKRSNTIYVALLNPLMPYVHLIRG